jgi:hypothetical protein
LHTLHSTLATLLQHLLSLGGCRVMPLLAQVLALLGRKLLESPEILSDLRLLVRWQ